VTLAAWLDRSAYLPPDAFPARPDLGARYPWRDVALHARSREMARKIRRALDVIRRAREIDESWWLALSGKDSRAVAFLAREAGWTVPCLSVGDDAAMPGEEASVAAAAREAGHPLTWIRPAGSVIGYLRARASLLGDLHTRASDLAAWSFYVPLEAHRVGHGPYGLLWGLRAQESRGRRLRYAVSGPLYQHATEGWRCSPIADWSALDVHAYLWAQGHALHPVYLCIDPGMDPLGIRTDWWFSVGWHLDASAHFGWLRRWWPACWRLAVEIDPEVGRLS